MKKRLLSLFLCALTLIMCTIGLMTGISAAPTVTPGVRYLTGQSFSFDYDRLTDTTLLTITCPENTFYLTVDGEFQYGETYTAANGDILLDSKELSCRVYGKNEITSEAISDASIGWSVTWQNTTVMTFDFTCESGSYKVIFTGSLLLPKNVRIHIPAASGNQRVDRWADAIYTYPADLTPVVFVGTSFEEAGALSPTSRLEGGKRYCCRIALAAGEDYIFAPDEDYSYCVTMPVRGMDYDIYVQGGTLFLEFVFEAARTPVVVPTFTDVKDGLWYSDAVDFVSSLGLMEGVGGNRFGISAPTTRGMMMTILARMEGVNTNGSPWYKKGMEWAKSAGISDGKNPTATITREQFATMLYRYAELLGQDRNPRWNYYSEFKDADEVSRFAENGVNWCVYHEILTGKPGKKLDPKGTLSRAEAAVMLYRFCELIGY